MYRVLAARSLKFLEQREEDTISYQRQLKESRGNNAIHAAGATATASGTSGTDDGSGKSTLAGSRRRKGGGGGGAALNYSASTGNLPNASSSTGTVHYSEEQKENTVGGFTFEGLEDYHGRQKETAAGGPFHVQSVE